MLSDGGLPESTSPSFFIRSVVEEEIRMDDEQILLLGSQIIPDLVPRVSRGLERSPKFSSHVCTRYPTLVLCRDRRKGFSVQSL